MGSKNIHLPEIAPFKPVGDKMLGGTPHYGAIQLAAKYTGVQYRRWMHNFCWHHGCMPPWQNIHPGAISYGLPKEIAYFVARKDQAQYLKENGYPSVSAIGLPILYLPHENIERLPNSLLIMPPHVNKNQAYEDPHIFTGYINYIKDFCSSFTYVAACINSNCLEKGYWVNEFKEIGIDIIQGASSVDANALLRQSRLFKTFETVTSNAFGSHIAYALYFGSKVALCGPSVGLSKTQITKDDTWSEIGDIGHAIAEKNTAGYANEELLQSLVGSPFQAIKNPELGAYLIGAENKISPLKMKELFNWGRSYTAQLYKEKALEKWHSFTQKAQIRTRIKNLLENKK